MTQCTSTLEFIYDESGNPLMMIYAGTPYYYVTNQMGDVVKLVNSSGTSVAEYTYNAWGEHISSGGSMASINPLRYRGYYFDEETGLYYLNSRYYDPKTCRFINADDTDVLTASLDNPSHDKNLFAYCDNNPVVRTDGDGDIWAELLTAVAIAAVTVAVATAIVATAGTAGAVLATTIGAKVSLGGFSAAAITTAKVMVPITAKIAGGSVLVAGGVYLAKGGKQRIRDSGLTRESSEEIARRLKEPNTSKKEKQRLKRSKKLEAIEINKKGENGSDK